MGVLVITHYQRLLNYIKPDFVMCSPAAASSKRVARNWRSNWKKRATDRCSPNLG